MKEIVSLYQKKKGILGSASASLADQVLLSLLNLAIGVLFIKYANKQEYATYAQIYAIVYLTSSVQSALINSPALTLLPQESAQSRSITAGSFFALQASLSILIAIIFGAWLYLFPETISFQSSTALLSLVFALTIWVVWLRDFLRNQLFIAFRAVDCLLLDLIYFVLCLVMICVLIKSHAVNAIFVLVIMFFAAILSALPWIFRVGIDFHFDKLLIIKSFNNAWRLAKWALPGGLVSWAFGNGYVLIAAYTIGSAGTAEIVAARLFVAPLGMIYLAWSNIFRPKASHWIAQADIGKVKHASYAALVAITIGVLLYSVVLLLAYPLLESHVLTQKYFGLTQYIAIWIGFFFASGLASIGTGVLLALGHYKNSFYAALAGCVVSIPLMFILGLRLGQTGLLYGLTIGELVTAFCLIASMVNGLNQMAFNNKTR